MRSCSICCSLSAARCARVPVVLSVNTVAASSSACARPSVSAAARQAPGRCGGVPNARAAASPSPERARRLFTTVAPRSSSARGRSTGAGGWPPRQPRSSRRWSPVPRWTRSRTFLATRSALGSAESFPLEGWRSRSATCGICPRASRFAVVVRSRASVGLLSPSGAGTCGAVSSPMGWCRAPSVSSTTSTPPVPPPTPAHLRCAGLGRAGSRW